MITDIALGSSVWSAERRDKRDEPVGGVVVGVSESTDPETGEIERVFVCVDPYRSNISIHRLRSGEVSPLIEAPETARRIPIIVRNLANEIRSRKGMLDRHDADQLAWMHTLVGVVFGAGRGLR